MWPELLQQRQILFERPLEREVLDLVAGHHDLTRGVLGEIEDVLEHLQPARREAPELCELREEDPQLFRLDVTAGFFRSSDAEPAK